MSDSNGYQWADKDDITLILHKVDGRVLISTNDPGFGYVWWSSNCNDDKVREIAYAMLRLIGDSVPEVLAPHGQRRHHPDNSAFRVIKLDDGDAVPWRRYAGKGIALSGRDATDVDWFSEEDVAGWPIIGEDD